MNTHLTEDVLLDLIEGQAPAEARAHAAACTACRAQVEEARAGLGLAQQADMPEPSPFYWQSFRQQVGRRIEATPTAHWQRLPMAGWAAAAAAIVAGVALLVPRTTGPAPATPAPSLPVLEAWTALPAAEDDEALDLLAMVVPAAAEAGPLAECQGLGDCMSEAAALDDADSAALAAALERELGASS